ncbi:hypothetical protein PAXRUDRAFT_75212, partial [Paxillus rubicundulus Ve08.2h10]
MDAEGATKDALEAVDQLSEAAASRSGVKIRIPAKIALPQKPNQTVLLEAELEESVRSLKSRNHIFGTLLTVNEILDPVEERDLGDFELDGSIKRIADEVRREMASAVAIEIEDDGNNVDSDDVDDDSADQPISRTDLISLCQQLEAGCMQYGDAIFSYDLSCLLFKYRANLRREELLHAIQTSLDSYF